MESRRPARVGRAYSATIIRRLAIGAAVFCGSLTAQVIVPRTMATREGGSSTAIPFGLSQPARVLCLYDAEELPWTGPTLISGIDLRADNDVPSTTSFAQKQYIAMHVRLSTAARRSDVASATFDDNHGIDATFVLTNSRLSLPAQPPSATAPRPCNVSIPITPFFFDLSPIRGPRPPPPGLAIEFRVVLQPVGDYRLDSPLQCASTISSFGSLGPLCRTGRGLPLTITPNSSVKAGDRVTYTVDNMLRDTIFVVSIGSLAGVGQFGGFPLPISMAPLQAPDCYVNTDWLLLTPGLGDQNGRGQVSYTIPPGRQLVGRSIHAQALCRDLIANPFLHVTSLGVSASICGPLGMARISALGDEQAVTGAVSYGAGYVIQLQ